MNFNLGEVRWYFSFNWGSVDLSKQYLFANEHQLIKNKKILIVEIQEEKILL